ncbi:MAG: L,D-transpeptidase family protein [Acidiferrobacterales bacterium]
MSKNNFANTFRIIITINNQTLSLLDQNDQVIFSTKVSTASNGAGETADSEKTPRGEHIIRAKIGAGQAVNTIFVGRRTTGEKYSPGLRKLHPDRDWILTRILWLSGTEPGKNRLGKRDTMRRFIYIHGAPADDEMGIPGSHGCIKMKNEDVIKLFDLVAAGTPVTIVEQN